MYLAQQANLLSSQTLPSQVNSYNSPFNTPKKSQSNQSIMNFGITTSNNLNALGQFGQTSFPAIPPAYSEDSGYSSSFSSTKDYQPDLKNFSVFDAPSFKNSFSGTSFNGASAFEGYNSSNILRDSAVPVTQRRRHQALTDTSSAFTKSNQEVFARKVFVGGLPIDVSEEEIWQTFKIFGNVLVDWPRRPDNGGRHDELPSKSAGSRSMTGYVFLVFEEELSVRKLVQQCHKDGDRYYLFVSSPTMRYKPVQVRPWKLADMEYMLDPTMPLDPRRTVFIGGVPRPTRANELAECLNKLYGSVCYVGIDIDPELKYPKGAARVTFSTTHSFIAAITGRFVHVHHAETQKRVEIKPYVMDEQMCDECQGKKCLSRYAPYFCGDLGCLQYFCETCWDKIHLNNEKRADHRPLVRMGDQTKILARPPHHNPPTSRSSSGRQSYFSRNN